MSARIPEVLGEHYAITYPGYQWSTARNLKTTPLHDKWVENRSWFGQFGGWERPLYFNCDDPPTLGFKKPKWFDQVGLEVQQAHEKVAIFDQSTFGKISVVGPDAETFLNRICANDMTRPPGSVIYTAMLNQRGGYESDLTALRLDDESYRLYVGTTAIKRDLCWLRNHLQKHERVRIIDETDAYAVIGGMGPEAQSAAIAIGASELNTIPYFRHQQLRLTVFLLSPVDFPMWGNLAER